jgi:two-component system, sensor histidine kinase PdtaS
MKATKKSMLETRMRLSIEQAAENNSEEGSDVQLLLDALMTSDDYDHDHQSLLTHFEQSGCQLAEQGTKLDVGLSNLQECVNTVTIELRHMLQDQPELLNTTTELLYQLSSQCVLALSRGYQTVLDQCLEEKTLMFRRLEHRLQALQHINGVSNSTMDLDQTLEITAQVVAEELRVDLCSVFFYDELQRVLTLRATNGPRPFSGIHFTLRLGEGYSGWVADQGRPVIVNDALADANFASEASAYPVTCRGLMALPIIFFGSAERLIGVISVQSQEPRDFTQDEISFMEVVSGMVAINIENGRLYEQTDEQLRRKVYELATIHRVSNTIAMTLNLDEVLQIITTQAVHLSGAERSCIFELDPDRQRLHLLAHYGVSNNQAARTQIGVGQCCAGRSVQTGRPSMAVDCFLTGGSCFLHSDPFMSAEIHSVLCVPLKVKQKILGCICIYSSHRHLLSPEQIQLVVTFANEAAIAIENARLYEETRRGLELKSALLRELNHRVKNNLANVAGILSLQQRRTKSAEVRTMLAETINRVLGLAATHDLLAHEEVSEARLDDLARKIVGVAHANLCPPDKRITFQVEASPTIISSRAATILALVINEMISNAIKHGLAGVSTGTITVRGREEDMMVSVQVLDTGKGPQQSIEGAAEGSSDGLGLSLIQHLIGDLDGKFSLRHEVVSGPDADAIPTEQTIAEVRFPLVRRR